MLKIRMQRIGRRNEPHFRVIVADVRKGPKTGRFIEKLGSYDAKMGNIQLNGERIKYWLSVGAQTSTTVHNFLVTEGIIDAPKKNALPKRTAPVKEVPAEEEEVKEEAAPADETKEEEAVVA